MRYRLENRKKPFTVEPIKTGLSPVPHIHPHLELIYLHQGASMTSLDGREYLLEAGDLFVAFPNQIHHYHDCSKTAGYVLIFEGKLFPDFVELFKNKVPVDPVIRRACLPAGLDQRIEQVYDKITSGKNFDHIAAKGHMLAILAEVLPLMNLSDTPASQDSTKSVLMYCMDNYTEPLTLDILARDLHLNKYYISHIFQKRMKTSFSEFVNSLRVEHACELLSEDCSITEVAYASGFSSIRSFNRIFSDKTGVTPTRYIKQKRL